MARTKVKVVRYKGDMRMQRGIAHMLKKGWAVQDSASRRAVWSPVAGILTRKQIHTVTFVKEG